MNMQTEPIRIIGGILAALVIASSQISITLVAMGVDPNWVRLGEILVLVIGSAFGIKVARNKVYAPATVEKMMAKNGK